jgi:sodium transport system ATP-binding protein
MIVARGLVKKFGEVEALKGVSFEAPNGCITGLLGPNGAGKTTALRIIYTLLDPDRGTAEVDGINVVDDPIGAKRSLGALPDSKGLYPRLTSRENIRYFGQLQGMKEASLEKRIDELVAVLEMQDIADRRAQGFSTGERMKVAIARALVHRPQTLLLDEPTSGLDVMATRAMRTFIRRLRDEGHAILFSSHVMQEVAALCGHMVIISHGKVVATGSPDELRQRTGEAELEDAFVKAIGTAEGLS